MQSKRDKAIAIAIKKGNIRKNEKVVREEFFEGFKRNKKIRERGFALPHDYGDRIFRPGAEINKRIEMGVIKTPHNKHFEDMTPAQQRQIKRSVFGTMEINNASK